MAVGKGEAVVFFSELEKFDSKMAEAENSPPGLRGGKGVHWNLKICVLKKTFCFVSWENILLVGGKLALLLLGSKGW